MSVESFAIAALVEEGSVKKAFQANVSEDDFDVYDEEFQWLVQRTETRKPINPRVFKARFPDFDFLPPQERTQDLLEELKQERTFIGISGAIEEVINDLDQDNAVDKALQLRERLTEILRTQSLVSDVLMKDWKGHIRHIKELQILIESGQVAGLSTGIPHFDHHWGGLQKSSTYVGLGRPGDAKSFTIAKFGVEGMLQGARVGLFSPEMTEHQHRCRINTLLSANSSIQQACGLKNAFRNRALKDGKGFNIKKYQNFLEYVEREVPGEIMLFTQKYRRQKMTPQFIESRVEDLGIELLIVDPIYKLKSNRQRQSRVEELYDIVDSLQEISSGFNIPVVMTNQASRALVGRKGEAPDKDSSFGADAPAQEADVVFGVKHFSEDRQMRINCSKNRHGESFKFTLKFYPNIGVMEDVTPIKGDYFKNGFDLEQVSELQRELQEQETAGAK